MLPKARLVLLTVSAGVLAEGLNWIEKLLDTPFSIAVIVAVRVDVTAPTVAVNPAVDLYDLTYTLLGTVTAGSLLDRLTTTWLYVVPVR